MFLRTSKTIRAGLSVLVAAGVLTSLSGCTSDEIAASALIIGAAAIASGADVRIDDGRGPRHGGWDRGDQRGGWGRGPGHRPGEFAATLESANLDAKIDAKIGAAPAFVSTDARVVALAKNYNISHYAATYLVRAIVLAEAKDTTGVTDLGLSVSDFKDLYAGRQMEMDKVETLGAKLKMSNASTLRLVQDMTADVQAEKAARGL